MIIHVFINLPAHDSVLITTLFTFNQAPKNVFRLPLTREIRYRNSLAIK